MNTDDQSHFSRRPVQSAVHVRHVLNNLFLLAA